MDNLTIEGDILYPVEEIDLSWSANGRWTASVTPTKPGGTITITIDWPGDENGTASQTLKIINGTHVKPSVDAFTVGSDYNLTVTVSDVDDAPLKYAMVYLMWEETFVCMKILLSQKDQLNIHLLGKHHLVYL